MALIVPQFNKNDDEATFKAKIKDLVEFWNGDGATSTATNWGHIRALLNASAIGSSPLINNNQRGSLVYDALVAKNQSPIGGGSGILLDFSNDYSFLRNDNGIAVGNINDVITFTRPTGGTYFDATGVLRNASNNQWRYDHDPATGEPIGVLIEQARTNYIVGSTQPGGSNGLWSLNGASVTLNAATAPDGTMTATLIRENNAFSSHRLQTNMDEHLNAFTTVYNSVFVKKAPGSARNFAYVWTNPNHDIRSFTYIDLTTGELSGSGGTGDWAVDRSYAGNGWWRVYLKGRASGGSPIQLAVSISPESGVSSYQGDGTSGILVWGYQQERGMFHTSYIPTTTATATRSKDNLVVNQANWIGPEGTLSIDAQAINGSLNLNSQTITQMDSGNNINRIIQTATSSNVSQQTFANGAQVAFQYVDGNAYERFRFASTYSSDGIISALNGTLSPYSSFANPPTGLNRLSIGNSLNGWAQKVRYVSRRLTDSELQEETEL